MELRIGVRGMQEEIDWVSLFLVNCGFSFPLLIADVATAG